MTSGRGFTLLETMVALALVGIVVVALLRVVTAVSDQSIRGRATTTAMALAEQEMELAIAAVEEGRGGVEEGPRSFPPPYESFRYEVAVSAAMGGRLIPVTVRVDWEDRGGGRVALETRVLAPTGDGR